MNKIKKSLDKVLPNDNQKEIMLSNILYSKYKKKNYYYLIPVFTCLCIIIYGIVNINTGNSIEPSMINYREINITYNNKNYCYEKRINKSINLSDLEKIKGTVPGGTIYILNDNELILSIDNVYKKYNVCKGERK